MSLIAIAIYDTPENERAQMTDATLKSLLQTVDFSHHRLFLSINEATGETLAAIEHFAGKVPESSLTVINNGGNIGTARAINKAWKHRAPGEMCIKMDNDVVIHDPGWVEIMEEAIRRDPKIGIIGLKRRDLEERPDNPQIRFRSTITFLPPIGGYWLPVERVDHVMGTCQAYNALLLDQIGYLYQMGVYGFDDSLAAVRCKVAGYYSCFIPFIRIDHIDPGDKPYQKWKEVHVRREMDEYNRIKDAMLARTLPIYADENGELVEVGTATAQRPVLNTR